MGPRRPASGARHHHRTAAELVYPTVGADRFEAQLIGGACPAAGVRVELLTAADSR